MKKEIIIMVIVVLASFEAGAVLFKQMSATLEFDVPIIGKSSIDECIEIWGPWSSHPHGDNMTKLLFDGAEIPIPSNISDLTNGYVRYWYCIFNNGSTNTYTIRVSVDNSWFDNTSHPWYGFTYGFGHPDDNSYVQQFTLEPHSYRAVSIWFEIDDNMVTPPGGIVHPKITIETI